MHTDDLLARVCRANHEFLVLGDESFEAHGAAFVRNPATPRRYDANHVGLIRTSAPDEIEALLAQAEEEFRDFSHRQFVVDGLTPPQFQARLLLEDGYRANEFLVQVLEGDLQATPKLVEIREVLSDEDWRRYKALDAMWWLESGTSDVAFGPYDEALHDEFMLNIRLKAPEVRRWFAIADGEPRAFFASWPGPNGVGMVEDLFCHPEYRNRGLATALIAHCVADARARGAGPILINSNPPDTPKHIYARMGFRPLYVMRTYVKRLPG